MSAAISVEVVYAFPDRQILRRVRLPAGSRVADAVQASGLLAEFPGIDPACVGIFGKLVQPQSRLQHGDRVEIYRPLRADPKDVRRASAGAGRRKKRD
jgi:uncharacterized protein